MENPYSAPRRLWSLAAAACALWALGTFTVTKGEIQLDTVVGFTGTLAIVGALFFAITAWNLTRAVRLFDALAAGEGLLARWTFDDAEWQAFLVREAPFRSAERRRSLVRNAMPIAIFVGFVVYVEATGSFPSSGSLLLIGSLGLLFAGLAARLWIQDRRQVERDRILSEAWIGRDGLVFRGRLIRWLGDDRQLDRAVVEEGMLHIHCSTRGRRTGWIRHSVRLPVPRAHEDEAERVAQQLMSYS